MTVPALADSVLRAVCDVLGHTSEGLSNSEINKLLTQCAIEDPTPSVEATPGYWHKGPSKRDRLFAALQQRQQRDGCGNTVCAFVMAALHPASYLENERLFEERRSAVNDALGFAGLSVDARGELRQAQKSETLSEGRRRAKSLRVILQARSMHGEVMKACRPELLDENYFHAVLEAAKSIAERLRSMTGLVTDGRELVDAALGGIKKGAPMVALNALQSSEQSEHTGIRELMNGVFSAFRNPTAHEPKIAWVMSEHDALDALSTISLIHRKLDGAVVLRRTP